MKDIENIRRIAQLLKKSNSILFITGSGISRDSGLPTYRGSGGLYNDNLTYDGVPIETALAGYTLKSHPEITWKYLLEIEEKCRNARFNRAHEIIAQMERHFKRVWVLTQNIDGLHHAVCSRNVIDIHGNMYNLFCPYCNWHLRVKDYSELTMPPTCPVCSHIIRPDVVFFGEMLPQDKLKKLYYELERGFDIYFSIGTTSVFTYIKEPILLAKSLSKPTIEINPGSTEISDIVDIKLSSGALESLDKIWKEYLN